MLGDKLHTKKKQKYTFCFLSNIVIRSRIVCHCRQTAVCLSSITLDWRDSERLEEDPCLTQFNEENPSAAAEVTRGRWRSSADEAAIVTAGTLVT